jgi:hypothetical protein
MLEAEGAESDLTQIFSAIQSAVKPTTTIIQQRLISGGGEQGLIGDGIVIEDGIEAQREEEEVVVSPVPRRAKAKTARKPTTPDVLDFDFETDVSLVDFAGRHSGVDSDVDRYLVIAAWFKEHRDTAAVTTSHIYTGYRTLDWPSGIEDFGAVLRYLKAQKFMASGARGEYSINHLGLAKVKKLAGS